jgi:hypothetical protein
MRLKSALWVAAYLRRCQVEGAFAVVRRRGAVDAGAIFVRVSRLAGTSDRTFAPSLAKQPALDEAVDAYLARETKFDPDVWIVELEDPAGRNFLDLFAG